MATIVVAPATFELVHARGTDPRRRHPPLQLDAAARTFSVGARFAIELHRDTSDYTCSVTNPGAQVSGSSTFDPSGPEVGLRVRSATARYHWVMIVSSP